MASHPTSMSLSSFSFSSLSLSSNDSSSSSSPNFHSTPAFHVASVVPFLWEEKPGISKHDMRKIEEDTNRICPPSSSPVHAAPAYASAADDSLELPPLRLPPRLSSASEASHSSQGDRRLISGARDRGRSVSLSRRLSGAWDGGLSESFTMRRLQRRSRLDDDPFWRAVKECTKKERATSVRGLRTHTRDGDRGVGKKDEVELIWKDKMAIGRNQFIRRRSKESPTFGSREWSITTTAGSSKLGGDGRELEGKAGKSIKESKHGSEWRTGDGYRAQALKASKGTIRGDGRRKMHAGSQAVELSCGRNAGGGRNQQQAMIRHSVHDMLGCMSKITLHSVKEPCALYPGGCLPFSQHHHLQASAPLPSSSV